MKQSQSNRKIIVQYSILILSIIGLMVCISVLFPIVRRMILDFATQMLGREIVSFQSFYSLLLSFAMGGICFILIFDYCILTASGRALVRKVKQEIKECLSEIDFHLLKKQILLMFGVYFLGILTIIRANFLYWDDILRAALGYRLWYSWSRYVSDFLSIFIHGDINLTDISPLPQLLAIFMLSISSVLLVYIIGNGKVTIVCLLASIPLGLSPFFLECLAFKFDAPYMALSILASIVPFLFIARKYAFIFCSVISLLIMCMTYQAASGIYLLIVVILCFQDWSNRKKPNKEILSFLITAALAFCLTMIIFRLFLMKSTGDQKYASDTMFSLFQIIPGALSNIENYIMVINHGFGIIWKMGIALVLLFVITKSIYSSTQKKILSFFVATMVIIISFILSYGVYILLVIPLDFPRAFLGFGVFLSIFCIYIVSDYTKKAIITALALNWCFFVFAFSYGNALADQARYAKFRVTLLLQDLSTLYPYQNGESIMIQFNNPIENPPSIKNIAKRNPIIEKLVPKLLGNSVCDIYYCAEHFNYNQYSIQVPDLKNQYETDFNALNLPVVLDSYYHTIKSDGNHVLIILKH